MRRCLLLCGALMLVPPAAAQDFPRLATRAVTVPDTLRAFDGRMMPAERTTLRVDHLAGTDTIRVDVVYLRLPATTGAPGSPIVFLMGGPGVPASVIGRVPPYFTLFDRLRGVADVILLDQRGTGSSRPALDCPATAAPAGDLFATAATLATGLAQAYAPCVAGWRAAGMPAELFSVRAIARDIDAIRRTREAYQVSLLGFSYGTRLALEYARLFPDRTDRVVLQGVLGYEHGVRLPASLDALLDRVDAHTPDDLRGALARQFAALDRERLVLRVPTADGDTAGVIVGREGLQALVSLSLADRRLPALVAMLNQGDTRLLALLVGNIYRDLAAGGGSMFGRAVYCSAPPPAAREAEARRTAAGTMLGAIFDNVPVSPAFCERIGIAPGRPEQDRAVPGGTALLIEGTLDDRTPLGNAAEMAARFMEATVVTVEHGGHELLPAPEIQDLVAGFFAGQAPTVHRITWPAPTFLTVEQALQPPRRPGQ